MAYSRLLIVSTILFLSTALISISYRNDLRVSQHLPRLSLFNSLRPVQQSPYAFVTILTGPSEDEKTASVAAEVDADPEDGAAAQQSHWWKPYDLWKQSPEGKLENNHRDPDEDGEENGYYLSARMLVYMLLHHKNTRSNMTLPRTSGKFDRTQNTHIPVVVLYTPSVPLEQLSRLERDGATLIPAPPLSARWVRVEIADPRWHGVLSKLHLFTLTQYRKVCFIDADTLVVAPLDGVFNDPSTEPQATRTLDGEAARDDEAPLPSSYAFAAGRDNWAYDHPVPPTDDDPTVSWGYFNSGFFVATPNNRLFDYYVSVLRLEGRFGAAFPDQDLLNYAHRRDANMPYQSLGWEWNANWPTSRDLDAGTKSFHAKYWEDDDTHDPVLLARWEALRDEMRNHSRRREQDSLSTKRLGSMRWAGDPV